MESDFSKLFISSDENQKTGWYDLPYEMRIMIIEMMDTTTRGKLSSCSKLCCQEVRGSKNYITRIELNEYFKKIELAIGYEDFDSSFTMVPKNDKEQCLISYKTWYRNGSSSKLENIVDGSMDDVALEHFNRFVNDAIHLKEIWIKSEMDRIFPDRQMRFRFDKTCIKHLKKLEYICIGPYHSIDLLDCGFLSIDQLASAFMVEIPGERIEIDQLIEFKAHLITLQNFTVEKLKQYLTAWNNNQINYNTVRVEIECPNDYLICKVDDIVGSLDVVKTYYYGPKERYVIKNNAGKLANLIFCFHKFTVELNLFDGESDTFE